jgi:hypothetical protein
MQRRLRCADLVRIWPGIYSLGPPDALTRLRGLDLRCGEHVAVCMGTAAAAFGFDTETVKALHVLNPAGHLLRNSAGLVVHRRDGARSLRRPRALATLDAAVRSQTCTRHGLSAAAKAQVGRRGIVMIRELVAIARPESESPMESEARLAMLEGGLPEPELQYEIVRRAPLASGFRPARSQTGRRIRRVRLAQLTRSATTGPQKEPHSRKSAGGCCRSSATMSGVTPR